MVMMTPAQRETWRQQQDRAAERKANRARGESVTE
jgi:hypothetical protein